MTSQGYLFSDMAHDKEEEKRTKEFEANAYYLSISALQKCVRRGMSDEANRFGNMAYRLKPYAFFQRLHTILFEDCAFDLPLLRWFKDQRFHSKNESAMFELITRMCEAVKADNSTCALSLLITGNDPPNENVVRWLVDNDLEEVLDLRHDWDLYKYQWYDDRIDSSLTWLIDVCERSNRFDREKLAVCIPLLVNQFGEGAVRTHTVVHECRETPMIDGWIPACAMDGHTRPGLIALRVLFSRLERVVPAKYDKNIVFYYEGGRRNNKLDLFTSFKDVYSENYNGVELKSPRVQEFYEKYVQPELDGVREWVVDTKMKESFEFFKDLHNKVVHSCEYSSSHESTP